jgi:hypothetical protein
MTTLEFRPANRPPNVDILWGMKPQEIDLILSAARPRRFSAKSVTTHQSDSSDHFLLMWKGRGRFFYITPTGKKLILLWIKPGETFGVAGLSRRPCPYLASSEAGTVLRAYRDFIKKASEHVSGYFAFLTVPPTPMFPAHLHLKKVCGIVWCSTGTPEQTEEATKPMRSVGHALLDQVGPAPFPVVQSLFDGLYVSGLQWYWRADNFTELSEEAITRHVEHGSKLPTMHSTMHLYPVNGAPQRVGKSDTPYSFREALFAEVIVGVDPDPANNEEITNWCKNYWEALHPFSAGGAYVNFMMEEGQERVPATYRENYERLVAIKRKYDPNNFFRVNLNIQPDAVAKRSA